MMSDPLPDSVNRSGPPGDETPAAERQSGGIHPEPAPGTERDEEHETCVRSGDTAETVSPQFASGADVVHADSGVGSLPACGEGPGWGETGSILPADEFCPMQCTINPTLDSDLPAPHLGPSPQAVMPSSDPPMTWDGLSIRPTASLPGALPSGEPGAAAEKSAAGEIEQTIVIDGLLRSAGIVRAFRGLNGRYYAAVLVNGRLECYVVDSDDFHRLLMRSYHDATGRALPPVVVAYLQETLRARAERKDESTRVVVKRTRRETWPAYVVYAGSGRRRPVEIHARGRPLGERPGVMFWRRTWWRAVGPANHESTTTNALRLPSVKKSTN
jgi:hypothetical protein